MISEISFDAAIAHGNFSVEPDPTTVSPQVKSQNLGERHDHKIEIPVPNEINEPAILAVILIGKISFCASNVWQFLKLQNLEK